MTPSRPASNKRTRRRGRVPDLPRLLAGLRCLDFANTIEGPISDQPEDFLRDYGELVRWAWHAGAIDDVASAELQEVAAADETHAQRAFAHALGMREAIDRAFRALAAGAVPPDEDLRVIRDEELEALGAASLTHVGDRFEWTWRDVADLRLPTWAAVTSAMKLLTEGDLARVKQCPGAGDCGWLFYDTSRNRSRRWCSMEGCGSRVKMRRHYARRRPG